MENKIVAREKEKQTLKRLYFSENPEFLAVYGRRRVGKTFLINEYFEDKGLYFEIIGSKNASTEVQIARFCHELALKFHRGKKQVEADNWEDAMRQLVSAIDEQQVEGPRRKITLFFDELPWLENKGSGFLSALDYLWNKYLSRPQHKNVLLIVCGSAAAWMINKIINNKAGLYNRLTEKIRLDPFTPAEVKLFLEAKGITLEKKQLLELYFALGGIPAYLNMVRRGQSAKQIVNTLCFEKDGFLAGEFEMLFQSLFERHHHHIAVVRALAHKRQGMTRAEIIQRTELYNGGETTRILKELEEAGFIFSLTEWGSRKKARQYRLGDEYSMFYIHWIEPSRGLSGTDVKNYWTQKSGTASWHAWAGFTFENVCMKHIDAIKSGLGISGILTRSSGWHFRPGEDGEGVQIDLVIERADNTINLMELKYARDVFVVSKEYAKTLERKKEVFRKVTKTRYQLFTTLMTTYGAAPNAHYLAAVDNQLTMDCLFQPPGGTAGPPVSQSDFQK